jgi:hypothetical protein
MPILLTLLFVAAGKAFGQAIDTTATYHIIASHSGKCLDVSGGSGALENGVQVIQNECMAGADSQKWKLTSVGDNYYKIMVQHSGKALDVNGGILMLRNGVPIKQWDYWGGANQMWKLISVGGGYFEIMAKHSGKSLDIEGGPGARGNGAPAKQYDYWGGDNQKWMLTALPTTPACTSSDSLIASFTGTAELTTTHPNARGPFMSNINLTVKFVDCRANLIITNFPPILNSFEIPGGRNTSTVTMAAGGAGTFDSSNGRIAIPIALGFQNSFGLLGNSTLPLRLAAEGVADMEDPATGRAILRGTGTFAGGALNGYQGTLTVTGSFSPRPR